MAFGLTWRIEIYDLEISTLKLFDSLGKFTFQSAWGGCIAANFIPTVKVPEQSTACEHEIFPTPELGHHMHVDALSLHFLCRPKNNTTKLSHSESTICQDEGGQAHAASSCEPSK